MSTPTKREAALPGRCAPGLRLSSRSEINFRLLLEASLDLICLVRVRGAIHQNIYVTPSVYEVLGWTPEEFKRLPMSAIYRPESLDIIASDVQRIAEGQPITTVEVEAMRKDGATIWLENKVRVLHKSPEEMLVVVCMRDITQRKTLERQLASLALLDGLTGIANRRAFDEAFAREWRRMHRTRLPVSLILVDVDHFKEFNDTYGHQAGDDCLRGIATAIAETVQRPDDLVARYGGDEMVVLLPMTDAAGTRTLARRLSRRIATLCLPQIGAAPTITCGTATACPGGAAGEHTPEDLLMAADAALYTAKHDGRNRIAAAPVLAVRAEARPIAC